MAAHQAPLSLGFSRQEYWSGLPFPSPMHAGMLSRFHCVLTLCDPMDSSPPGSPVPGILQARTLEWVAISFSNAWKWKVKVKSLSHARPLATPWIAAYQALPSMIVLLLLEFQSKGNESLTALSWGEPSTSCLKVHPVFRVILWLPTIVQSKLKFSSLGK